MLHEPLCIALTTVLILIPSTRTASNMKGLTIGQKIDRWLVNEGRKRIFVSVFVMLQIMVFVFGFLHHLIRDNLTIARRTLGIGFPIARASALVLHVDAALILLPVCRTLISCIRNTALGSIIPFDKNIDFHKMIAWSMVIFGALHTLAHLMNFAQLSRPAGFSIKTFSMLNFSTGPGITGWLMVGILTAMVVTALDNSRRRSFERFWRIHHLFIAFFVLWQIHGSFCMITPDRAPFCSSTATFWQFWLLGATVYLVERILREIRGQQPTYVTKVIQHPSKVCEIQFKRGSIQPKAGQYIFLSCPEISLHQYHPFTLTSAPEEDYLSVHVRCVGDFTNQLATLLGCDFESRGSSESKRKTQVVATTTVNRALPKLMIDGPFGSASEDVFNFETVMLVCAGIGSTPAASILKSIYYRIKYPQEAIRLNKVYFFWICRDFDSFEWFHSLLLAIEEQDLSHVIEIHTYLTAKISSDAATNIMLNGADRELDAVTQLSSPLNYGRPAWDNVFSSIATMHPATDIGVFYWYAPSTIVLKFSGPSALGETLQNFSSQYTKGGRNSTRFIFGKENF